MEEKKPFEFDWSVPPIVGEIPAGWGLDVLISVYTDVNGNTLYEGHNGFYYSKLEAVNSIIEAKQKSNKTK